MTVESEIVFWETANLGLAAYLLSRGAELKGLHAKTNRIREHRFTFKGEKKALDEIILSFSNSPERVFDDNLRYLKSLCMNGNYGKSVKE